MIWRLTNNASQGDSTGPLGDIAGNAFVDIPAELVSVRWAASGPLSEIDVLHIQNQTLTITSTGANNAITTVQISSSGNNNVARAQLIEDNGFGKILFDQSA